MTPNGPVLRGFLRDACLVVVGIVLSWLLLSAGVWVTLQVIPFGVTWSQVADGWQRRMWINRIVIDPLTVVAVGCFIGFFARKRIVQLAALSVAPFLLFLLMSGSWDIGAFAASAIYLCIGCLSALGIYRLKAGRVSRPA